MVSSVKGFRYNGLIVFHYHNKVTGKRYVFIVIIWLNQLKFAKKCTSRKLFYWMFIAKYLLQNILLISDGRNSTSNSTNFNKSQWILLKCLYSWLLKRNLTTRCKRKSIYFNNVFLVSDKWTFWNCSMSRNTFLFNKQENKPYNYSKAFCQLSIGIWLQDIFNKYNFSDDDIKIFLKWWVNVHGAKLGVF